MLKIRKFLDYRKCSCCGEELLIYQLERINDKNDYICRNCKTTNSYSEKNYNYKGKQTQASFSFEFETSKKTNSLYELAKYNFIACSDATIGGLEWKSPIFYNKKSFHIICKNLDKFAKFVGNSCGTHLHVGTKYKSILKEYEYELFTPILDEMNANKQKTIAFWGRYFNNYCRSRIEDSRYNSFNTRSSVNTLEFRLLKFVNSEQYIRASDFCIDTTKYINFIIKKGDFDREKAIKTGLIIAKKYKEVIKDV